MCPNCPKVKEYMQSVDMQGELLDATTREGLTEARKFNVAAVPTVVFLEGNEEKSRASSVEEIKRIVENKTLTW